MDSSFFYLNTARSSTVTLTILMLSFYRITPFYRFVIHLVISMFGLRRVINQYTHLTHGLLSLQTIII